MSPDTVSEVIHDAAQRPSGRRRSSIVDNSGANSHANVNNLAGASAMPTGPEKNRIVAPARAGLMVPDATTRSRSDVTQPTRLLQRSPGRVAAPVQMSKRTPPPRGLRIRSTKDRPGAGDRRTPGDVMDSARSSTSPSDAAPNAFSTLT